MHADAMRRWSAALCPLLLASGCASGGHAARSRSVARDSAVTAPVVARAPIVQVAWPGDVVQAAKGSAVKLDAFEGLLVNKPLPLRSFP